MSKINKTMLVTSALPYANGAIHLGHMVEHIQADIWVRFQRSQGHRVYFICGDDAHGTPIMISAQKQGITPEELIAMIYQQHRQDFTDFNVNFDIYHTTHSEENKKYSNLIYQRLKARGDIESREIEQAFDPVEKMFLPDRYVKGECPSCGAADQYGDNCEACGATYLPTDVVNPVSVLSGATPIQKKSEHFFFRLENYQDMLQQWLQEGHVQKEVAAKLNEWFEAGLQQWDISRDAPYFGFEIPDEPGKYFYVWLDAPIGYIASFDKLCQNNPDLTVEAFWSPDSPVEMYHFVGKDIIYFHGLFWPAILSGSGFRTPTAVYTHGFLTVNGSKMSKSRGTYITARQYLDHLNPEYLRYYYAAKLGSGIDDIDLNFDDFKARVNSDLVGKVVNIASRCAGFITKKFAGQLADTLHREELFNQFVVQSETIAAKYEARDYNHAVREIMTLADHANQYIDEMKPWVLAKDESQLPLVQSVCTMGINLFHILMILLQPILPTMAENAAAFLNTDQMRWKDIQLPLLNHSINKFKPLMQRVDDDALDKIMIKDKTTA